MSISITPGKLGYEISRMLEEYALEAQEELDKAVRKAANETKKQIAGNRAKANRRLCKKLGGKDGAPRH